MAERKTKSSLLAVFLSARNRGKLELALRGSEGQRGAARAAPVTCQNPKERRAATARSPAGLCGLE